MMVQQTSRHAAEPTTSTPVTLRHLTQAELARRWRISPRTLERWRWLRQGPAYLKLGAVVAYQLTDVEAYEAAQRRTAAVEHRGPAASDR
jgi:hypothetical protein